MLNKIIGSIHEDHIEETDRNCTNSSEAPVRGWLRFTQNTADQIDKRSNENSKILEKIFSDLESM